MHGNHRPTEPARDRAGLTFSSANRTCTASRGEASGPSREHRHPSHFRKNEPLGLQGHDCAGQIGTLQEDIDILGISHGRFVDLGTHTCTALPPMTAIGMPAASSRRAVRCKRCFTFSTARSILAQRASPEYLIWSIVLIF